MRIDQFTFGRSIRIGGVVYEHDALIAGGQVSKPKKPSKPLLDVFGHPQCLSRRTSLGTAGASWWGPGLKVPFPVMDEVKQEAARYEVELLIVQQVRPSRALRAEPKDTNAILHVTC